VKTDIRPSYRWRRQESTGRHISRRRDTDYRERRAELATLVALDQGGIAMAKKAASRTKVRDLKVQKKGATIKGGLKSKYS
jgi:hypothetical protein